jgi:hypothetical protein
MLIDSWDRLQIAAMEAAWTFLPLGRLRRKMENVTSEPCMILTLLPAPVKQWTANKPGPSVRTAQAPNFF